MLTTDIVISFLGVAILLALAPGPDNIFVLTQSALSGRMAGVLVVLGLCTGLIGHTAAVAVGVAALFRTSPTAFNMLKVIGALYLLYLAWQSFRVPRVKDNGTQNTASAQINPPSKSGTLSGSTNASPLPRAALYRRGIIMNLSNPKVSLFFLAFLPQFTSPARGSVAVQTLSLGALFMLATLLVFGSMAFFAGMVGERLRRSPQIQTVMNRVAGIIFLGLAVALLLDGPTSV